jgi:hypothetical protein
LKGRKAKNEMKAIAENEIRQLKRREFQKEGKKRVKKGLFDPFAEYCLMPICSNELT